MQAVMGDCVHLLAARADVGIVGQVLKLDAVHPPVQALQAGEGIRLRLDEVDMPLLDIPRDADAQRLFDFPPLDAALDDPIRGSLEHFIGHAFLQRIPDHRQVVAEAVVADRGVAQEDVAHPIPIPLGRAGAILDADAFAVFFPLHPDIEEVVKGLDVAEDGGHSPMSPVRSEVRNRSRRLAVQDGRSDRQ